MSTAQENRTTAGREAATLGGGCFWCLDAVFRELRGVDRVESGYAGGMGPSPTYQQVCSGTTGYAEVVQVVFDPSVISFDDILRVFFLIHDPTTMNRQGADVGTQYRSIIFTHSAKQKEAAERMIKEIDDAGWWEDRVVTGVAPFEKFYPAEDYHQDYFSRNPDQAYCRAVVAPKVAKFRQHFTEKLKK